MAKSNGLKMSRQLQIYDLIAGVENGAVYGPSEVMSIFNISQRMLQRDLKDLRDCGLINVRYDRSRDRYVVAKDVPFDDTVPIRRRQHLQRLYRIGTLIRNLSSIDPEDLMNYESELNEYNEYFEEVKDDPENNSPDDIEKMREFYIPKGFEFYDLKAEYYTLFPDSNERTRARDFATLTEAGFTVKYSRRHRAFLVGPDIDPDEERHW